jgi:hypothetical protein
MHGTVMSTVPMTVEFAVLNPSRFQKLRMTNMETGELQAPPEGLWHRLVAGLQLDSAHLKNLSRCWPLFEPSIQQLYKRRSQLVAQLQAAGAAPALLAACGLATPEVAAPAGQGASAAEPAAGGAAAGGAADGEAGSAPQLVLQLQRNLRAEASLDLLLSLSSVQLIPLDQVLAAARSLASPPAAFGQ